MSERFIIEIRRDRVVDLSQRGYTVRKIAAELNLTVRMVERDRAARGIPPERPPAVPLTAAEIARARAMLDDGACYEEVARTIGRSRHAIQRNLPGYTWPVELITQAATLGRLMSRLRRTERLQCVRARRWNGSVQTGERV